MRFLLLNTGLPDNIRQRENSLLLLQINVWLNVCIFQTTVFLTFLFFQVWWESRCQGNFPKRDWGSYLALLSETCKEYNIVSQHFLWEHFPSLCLMDHIFFSVLFIVAGMSIFIVKDYMQKFCFLSHPLTNSLILTQMVGRSQNLINNLNNYNSYFLFALLLKCLLD